MSIALKLIDQTLGVHPWITRELLLANERTTLRELIRRRIEDEVQAINEGRDEVQPLVVPTQQETQLNGTRPPRYIDPDRQLAAAITAFERNRIIVIVDDRQVQDLDAPIIVNAQTQVRFLKLVPLAGG